MNNFTRKQIGLALFTFVVYTIFFNWKISLLIMAAVGFHEYSHLFAARKLGLKTEGFFMLPFIGGLALVSDNYKKLSDKTIIILAGPVGGGLLAGITAGLWYLTGFKWLAISAFWMAVLNLFNLLPLSFLDGGQLLTSIAYSVNRTFGVVVLAISTLLAGALIFRLNIAVAVFLVVFGGMNVYREIKNWYYDRKNQPWLVSSDWLNPPFPMNWKQMLLTISGWILTAGLLLLLMSVLPQTSLLDLK